MKRLLFFLIIVFVCSGYVIGQEKTTTPRIINWAAPDSPPNCCFDYLKNGDVVTAYSDENLSFVLTVDTELDKKYIAILLVFQNNSGVPFTVDPASFQLEMLAPINKTYTSIPLDKIAKEIAKRGLWRLALARGLAGMSTQQSTGTVTDSRGNQSQVVLTQPDTAAQANAARAGVQKQADNNAKAYSVMETGLRANTVFKKDVIGGYVFFKKEKLAPGIVLSFMIDGTIFRIPFGTERTKLSQTKSG